MSLNLWEKLSKEGWKEIGHGTTDDGVHIIGFYNKETKDIKYFDIEKEKEVVSYK